jgi:hypothetical protein
MKTSLWILMFMISWCCQAGVNSSEVVGGGQSLPRSQKAVEDNNIIKANICLLDGGTPESCSSVAILSTDAMKERARQIAGLSEYRMCVRLYCGAIGNPLYADCERSCKKRHLS